MSLVPIEEFDGTVNGNAVIETLGMIGLLGRLRQNNYTLNIEGVQPPTPLGYIEDCTDSHIITIDKADYLGKSKQLSFVKHSNKVDTNCKEYSEFIKEHGANDLKLKFKLGVKVDEKVEITIDANGDTWYRHIISISTSKGNKTDEEYVINMFETLANAIKDSSRRN